MSEVSKIYTNVNIKSALIPKVYIRLSPSDLQEYHIFQYLISDISDLTLRIFKRWFKYAKIYQINKHIAKMYMKYHKIYNHYAIINYIAHNYDNLYKIYKHILNYKN